MVRHSSWWVVGKSMLAAAQLCRKAAELLDLLNQVRIGNMTLVRHSCTLIEPALIQLNCPFEEGPRHRLEVSLAKSQCFLHPKSAGESSWVYSSMFSRISWPYLGYENDKVLSPGKANATFTWAGRFTRPCGGASSNCTSGY